MRLKSEAEPSRATSVDRRADADAKVRTLKGPVLVGFDDRHPIWGALRVADALAHRDDVNAHLLGVVRQLALPATVAIGPDLAAVETARLRQHKARLQRILQEARGIAASWSTESALGSAAPSLAAVAHTRRSALIVIGMARIGSPDRTASEDTTLRIIGAAPVPTLAVPPFVERLPARALVAVDFSSASLRAAATALQLLRTPAVITLAHVQPEVDYEALGQPGWDRIYENGRDALFDQLTADLKQAGASANDIAIDTAVLHGSVDRALLSLAEKGGYDLIAAGTARLAPPDRYVTGSVLTALLRGAACPILVAPPLPPLADSEVSP